MGLGLLLASLLGVRYTIKDLMAQQEVILAQVRVKKAVMIVSHVKVLQVHHRSSRSSGA